MRERRRIARLADSDETRAQILGVIELSLGLGLGAEKDVVRSAAAPGQQRQRGDGGFGAAELVDERAEGRGPHILAPNQPEPGEALGTAEPRGGRCRR